MTWTQLAILAAVVWGLARRRPTAPVGTVTTGAVWWNPDTSSWEPIG